MSVVDGTVRGSVGLCAGTVRGIAGAISGTARAVAGRYRRDVAMAKDWKRVRAALHNFVTNPNANGSDLHCAFVDYFESAGYSNDDACARARASMNVVGRKLFETPQLVTVELVQAEPQLSPAS